MKISFRTFAFLTLILCLCLGVATNDDYRYHNAVKIRYKVYIGNVPIVIGMDTDISKVSPKGKPHNLIIVARAPRIDVYHTDAWQLFHAMQYQIPTPGGKRKQKDTIYEFIFNPKDGSPPVTVPLVVDEPFKNMYYPLTPADNFENFRRAFGRQIQGLKLISESGDLNLIPTSTNDLWDM